MADKRPSPSQTTPTLHPANPNSIHSDQPFTPRSSTFPDMDSDSDFDAHDPTPVSSPGGPQYDDLPPSYDEAQQEALEHARAGIPPIDPNSLEVHRLVLNANAVNSSPTPPPQRVNSSLLDNPGNYELEPENRRNASHLGMNVPVTQVRSSEDIPVGRALSQPTSPTYALLERALEFTKYEADEDTRFAPRLTRRIAIPPSQIGVRGRHHDFRYGHRRGRGRGRDGPPPPFSPWARSMPGQWPTSEEMNNTNAPPVESSTETVQFLRSYAKTLHTHSIRPAEFAEFIDGLNVLCWATNSSASDLVHPTPNRDIPSSLVHNYINSANEAFFAPRGLKVSMQSLATLLSSLQIPEERGQRAAALASALDLEASMEQRAQAFYPWVEKLETDVPGQSAKIAILGEMGKDLRRGGQLSGPLQPDELSINNPRDPEKRGLAAVEAPDPEHSIPDVPPNPSSAGPGCSNGRNDWTLYGPPNTCSFGWNSRMPPPGPPLMPFRGGWSPGNHRGWGVHHGRHWHRPGPSGYGPGNRGQGDNWAAWGESIAKWGEEFGKRMEAWGSDFGRRAEEWGTDIGRKAEVFGEDIERRATGTSTPHKTQLTTAITDSATVSGPSPNCFTPRGQETGVLRKDRRQPEDSLDNGSSSKNKNFAGDDDDDDDDETSSLSSFSSSSSSSDDDNDEPEYPDTQAALYARIHEIDKAAEVATKKGKKPSALIARERDAAIAKARSEKTLQDLKIEQKKTKRTIQKDLRIQKKALSKQHKQLRKQLVDNRGGNSGSKLKLDKREKRHLKREWRDKKREHRDLKREARRGWREEREKWRKMKRSWNGAVEGYDNSKKMEHKLVWVVVENLVE